MILSASLMAAAGAVGASRAPVELDAPTHTSIVLQAPVAPFASVGLAEKVTSR